jgi:hypothetical protein
MGCSQSKATNQVVERVSVDTPAVEAPAPESLKTTESEVAVEAPPASTKELPPAPASVTVEAVEEAPKTEEPAAPVEEVVEEPAAPVEEPVADEPAAVEEPTEEAAPVEEEPTAPVEEEAAPVEEAPKTEEKAPEVAMEAPVKAEAPISEPAVEAAPKSEAAVEEPAIEKPVETPDEEPTSEAMPAPVSEAKPTEDALKFTAEEVTFNDKGVAFYNFDGSDGSNPANDVHVSKRYSEFKALHAQLATLLSDNQADLPALPKASLFQGRKNKKMLQDRKTQFNALLNAVASHPAASQSDVFKAFLA